ncbi:hypothetical protein V6N13_075130 [Hibiscus sabdariffa]
MFVTRFCRWKLNTYGAKTLAEGNASEGQWLLGFSKTIGKCSALEAKLFIGLQHAWNLDALFSLEWPSGR